MRVAVVCPAWPPVPGGVADNAARWTEALIAAGDVEAIVHTGPGAAPAPGYTLEAGRTAWGWGAAPALAAEIAAGRPDVVVLHYVPHLYQRRGLAVGVGRLARLLAGQGLPLVVMAHELYYGRHEALRHQPIGLIQRLVLRPLFTHSRAVVFSTPDRRARMAAVFPRLAARFHTIPVGAGLTPATAAEGAAWRRARGLGEDELALLFQGGFHPSKEIASLTAALEAAGPRARLVLIGGGALDHPRVLALGHVDGAEAGRALAGCDLALAPFEDGASGRRSSVVNALAAGLPTVSTRGVNTDPALFPPAAIRLVAPGDPQAFAQAVAALAADPAARAGLAAGARQLYAERFAWPVLAAAWLSILGEVSKGPAV